MAGVGSTTEASLVPTEFVDIPTTLILLPVIKFQGEAFSVSALIEHSLSLTQGRVKYFPSFDLA